MSKLTAEEVRLLIAGLSGNRTIREEKYLQALEIALPVLEQQERGESMPNHAQCCAEAGGDVSICDCVNKDWVYLAPQPTTDTYRQIENDGGQKC